MNLDYLAWAILALAFVFMLLPILGAANDRFQGYLDSLASGIVTVLWLGLIFLVLAAHVWALTRVFA